MTLATCLEVLGDSVPGVKITTFEKEDDTIVHLLPTGDPTFLHPYFKNWQPMFRYLKLREHLTIFEPDVFQDTRFGPGWAWDDYNEEYSPERSAMPIYGNVITIKKVDTTDFPLALNWEKIVCPKKTSNQENPFVWKATYPFAYH
ncbi:MAG: hypothetical protein IPH31_05580 [Lewinellaceae bacterium]|nr:hypothetical protein [Lewinellaceae bacterium]